MNDKFMRLYSYLGNVKEAARHAGILEKDSLNYGLGILKRRKKSIKEIDHIKSGFERIAFGNSNDAVYLLFAEECPTEDVINRLDLFNVSEIKKIKGGGVEVKFFDRQKALEKLYEYEREDDTTAAENLIEALNSMSEDKE